MNTKIFAFPQPSLAKATLYQDLDTSNQSRNKPPKCSSVPILQAKQYYTTVLLNKASKGCPELNLAIQHLGSRKKPTLNITSDPALEIKDIKDIPIPQKTVSSRASLQRGLLQSTTRNGPLFSLPNLNPNTTVSGGQYPTSFEIFKNLMDPTMNEIRGIEGVKLKEKEKEKPVIASHRTLQRKNTQPLESTTMTRLEEEEDVEVKSKPIVLKARPKLDMPLILDGTFRKEQERKSNKLTRRSNTGNFSQDGDDESELSTAQIFRHHMEENGSRPKSLAIASLPSIPSLENVHFRKNIKKIFKSQDHGIAAKDSHRSIDDHLNTTTIENNKRAIQIPSKNDLSTADSQEDSLQGWNCIRPVRIISEKASQRSNSNQGKVQEFAIKTYKNGVMKTKKRVVKNLIEIDQKIAKISQKNRTLEQNILSPLNESSSSEDDNFAEYVEAIKSESENILRML